MPRTYLEPLLDPDLCVVFIGTEPGPTSLQTGHYYANPNNTFWDDLRQASFTDSLLTPDRFGELLAFGIGLDDVYSDPRGLRKRIENAAPLAVCFNSKRALARMSDDDIGRDWMGRLAASLAEFAGVELVWALPDSSPRADRWHDKRVELLRELRNRLDFCLASDQ